jgi:hypothetical protein
MLNAKIREIVFTGLPTFESDQFILAGILEGWQPSSN